MHRMATVALIVLAACSDNSTSPPSPPAAQGKFIQANLVADAAGAGAVTVDTNLVNPWGMAFGGTGVLWTSNNHTGTSTLYDSTGTKLALVVRVVSVDSTAAGAPTGIVLNTTTAFVIPGFGKASFIFSGEDGVITAWNGTTGNARKVADRSSATAVYKGLAQADSSTAHLLFATDFKHNAVDVFDSAFQYVKSFTDSTVPAGFAPFGIQAISGQLYVTFAKQRGPDDMDDEPGAGNGYVDIFNTSGGLVKRLVSGGALNSPWGLAIANPSFGGLSGDLLVGNFGDGRINAYDATGKLLGPLGDSTGATLVIPELWGLTVGPKAASTTLFFSAGPDGEMHGLIGTLKLKP